MSASIATTDYANTIHVFQVANPEGRSVFLELVAHSVSGMAMPASMADFIGHEDIHPPPQVPWPSCPFIAYTRDAGEREINIALRVEALGWRPWITCQSFRLDAEHPAAYRPLVVPSHEDDTFDPALLARLKASPGECRAAFNWLREGARAALRTPGKQPPEEVLRATAKAVQ